VTPPYRPRQFVWCRYPSNELPDLPGPKVRIGYVLAAQPAGPSAAIVLYTTTVPWRSDAPRPLGLIPIDAQQAQRLGQKPFLIDARHLAILPLTPEFFPYMDTPDQGVQGTASLGLDRKIRTVLAELQRRQVALDVRGPLRPRR
jgi:hypothetical protein